MDIFELTHSSPFMTQRYTPVNGQPSQTQTKALLISRLHTLKQFNAVLKIIKPATPCGSYFLLEPTTRIELVTSALPNLNIVLCIVGLCAVMLDIKGFLFFGVELNWVQLGAF
jgi:hypothetical protein